MCLFDQLMQKGKELEAKGFYRRATSKYNEAKFIAAEPFKAKLSNQGKESSLAARRCLDKSRITIIEGL